jgi:tetratricopeptide (TPR) repeat protein
MPGGCACFSLDRITVIINAMPASSPLASATPGTNLARNDPCHCGSGRKFKRCCGRGPDRAPTQDAVALRPLVDPLTEAGRFLESFSPLHKAIREQQAPRAQRAAARPAADTRRRAAAQAHLDRAARHEAAGRLADAIEALRAAVRTTPDDAVAHYNLGLTCLKANRLTEAESSLRRAIALRADLGRAQFQLGVALQRQGREEEAIEALRAALALGAKSGEALSRLGDLLHSRGEVAEAAACYRRAADDSPTGRLNAAKALAVEERYEEAAAALRRLIALAPENATARWTLGFILSVQGRFEEALAQLERASALAPGAVGPFYNLIIAKRVTEQDRPLIARMTAVLESGALSDVARMKLHYALGKAFDDLKDPATAIRHFDAANGIEKPLAGYDREQLTAWVELLTRRCTPSYFREHAALGADDETPVFVLGMPRSGTTLVEQILSSHPRVAAGGEMAFWLKRGPAWEHSGPAGLTQAAIGRLAEDYRAALGAIGPDAARVTNKLPHNFMWIGLIHLVFPRARIIHCRRHPVDTCLSIYFTHFHHRMSFASDRGDLVFEYRNYLRLMDHWRRVLPPERFLEVDYEALVADREGGARRLIGFCGLDWDDACLHPERNGRAVTTASMWQARQPVYRSSVARWRRYAPWLGELRDLLAPEEAAP